MMNNNLIDLRNEWLKEVSSKKKSKKKNFYGSLESDLEIKKNNIFF